MTEHETLLLNLLTRAADDHESFTVMWSTGPRPIRVRIGAWVMRLAPKEKFVSITIEDSHDADVFFKESVLVGDFWAWFSVAVSILGDFRWKHINASRQTAAPRRVDLLTVGVWNSWEFSWTVWVDNEQRDENRAPSREVAINHAQHAYIVARLA